MNRKHFEFDDQVWTPENYEKTYDGPITFRHALAHSRNLGDDSRRAGRRLRSRGGAVEKLGVGNAPKAYPSIALGVFEATPFEIATAYTIFPNMGALRPLRHIMSITSGGANVTRKASEGVREIARHDTTFLVTNMMRSVLNEGTAAGARDRRLQTRRRRQDRHDQRPARRVVRGLHARAPHRRMGGLRRQPARRVERRAGGAADLDRVHDTGPRRDEAGDEFEVPEGISFVDIDKDNGKLALPTCPHVFHEAFLAGTEPTQACELHR